jgi:hypothetical protein
MRQPDAYRRLHQRGLAERAAWAAASVDGGPGLDRDPRFLACLSCRHRMRRCAVGYAGRGGSAAVVKAVSRHDGHAHMTLRWRCCAAYHRPSDDLSWLRCGDPEVTVAGSTAGAAAVMGPAGPGRGRWPMRRAILVGAGPDEGVPAAGPVAERGPSTRRRAPRTRRGPVRRLGRSDRRTRRRGGQIARAVPRAGTPSSETPPPRLRIGDSLPMRNLVLACHRDDDKRLRHRPDDQPAWRTRQWTR